MKMGEGKILKRLVKTHGFTDEDFASKLGVSRQSLSTWYGKEKLSDRVKANVCHFLKIDESVFESKESEETGEKDIEYEVTPLYKSKIKEPVLPETSIPVFNDGGSAGHAELYQDFKERPAAFIRVPGYEDCDFATYAYGHSMYPIIESGALILCRKTINKQMILWGEIYYIITSDHRLIKRLQKGSSKESVMAISENEEKRKDGHTKFEPIEIQVDDIKDLYIVKGIIKKIQI